MPFNQLPEGVKLLTLDPEKLMMIWEHFNTIPGILDDLVRGNFDLFQQNFYARDSIWLERTDGNGLLYATSIIPHLRASVHFVYWDKHLAGREEFTKEVLRWIVGITDVQKVNAWIPHFCQVAHKFAKRLGFKQEAYIRNWSYSNGKLYDVLCFGMTKEEVYDGIILRPDNTGSEHTEEQGLDRHEQSDEQPVPENVSGPATAE
jgi:hypothetical protein